MARPSAKGRKRLWTLVLSVVLICAAAIILIPKTPGPRRKARVLGPLKKVFDDSSEELRQTVIVPTLDTPMPQGKNVIWCASFQIAWNEMRDEIVGEPIRIANAEEIADRLNRAKHSKEDLVPGSYYAKVGAVADGVIEHIQKEMAEQFPDAPTPEIKASGQDFVAYAYLAANVKFTIPFFENDEEFLFDGAPVSSFGIRERHKYAYDGLRKQVEILYLNLHSDYDNRRHEHEFVIDPCKNSSPNQIILACIEPRETLAEVLSDVDRKMAGWNGPDYAREFDTADVILVPNTLCRIEHHFRELEGTDKIILNENCAISGYWIGEASQLTEFKLDRSGAVLKSEAKHVVKAARRYFLFNRPFLIVMKKRGAERPFFVMWVDNAELLCKP